MKKLLATALTALFLFGTGASADAKTYNLRYTSPYMPANAILAQGIMPWFKDVEKATNGQVKIRNFNPNTICPEAEIYTSIISGAIDMGGINHSRNAGKFPLHDVFSLPLVSGSSEAHAHAIWDVYQKTPALQKEMKEMKVMGYWAGGSMQIMTTKKPVRTMEDLKGLRICVLAKPFADLVTMWGANPIVTPAPDMYMALARNQADGVFFSISAMGSLKLHEHIKYVTIGNFVMDSFFLGMNQKLWNGLPDDVKKAIESTTADNWAARVSSPMDKADRVEREKMAKAGVDFYKLPADELARWTKAAEPMDKAWVDRMAKVGAMTAEQAEQLLKTVRAAGAEATAKYAK